MSNIVQTEEKIKRNHWLVKFAPFRTSWNDIVRTGKFTLRGVRSHAARKHLAEMRLDEPVLFYHSQQEKAVVGILKVIREAYPDPTSADPKWLTCDFAPARSLTNPVSLAQIRQSETLANIPLLRQPRLAVMPITEPAFNMIANWCHETPSLK